MHLNECLQLAFPRPTADAMDENVDADRTVVNGLSSLTDISPTQLQQSQTEFAQGPFISMLQCIVYDWGTKSQTNFYIPDEYYAGYSYLFDDERQPEWQGFEKNIQRHNSTYAHSHAHRQAFVYAQEPNNLHPQHYISTYSTQMPKMTRTAVNSTTNLIISASDSTHNTLHHPLHSSSIVFPQNVDSSINHAPNPMTVPYFHPHLEMPVPPLYLPWYFGAFCWSFFLGGAIMLYSPPKWALCGGGRVSGKKEEQRHWFPYRTFALSLMLCQSPCSFLADYVYMTNISLWHTIDRFGACTLMLLELMKLLVMRPYTRPPIYLLYLTCVVGAMCCFLQSQKSQETLNAEGFVIWHCGWHCYPLACSVVYFIENFFTKRWGEYYAFECETEKETEGSKHKRGESGGILLSTIMMNYWNNVEEKQPKYQSLAPNNVTGGKEWEQIQKSAKAKTVVCRDGQIAASFTDKTKSKCRSRRISGQQPDIPFGEIS